MLNGFISQEGVVCINVRLGMISNYKASVLGNFYQFVSVISTLDLRKAQ